MSPQQAWELAKKEERSVLRPAPRCRWWPYVGSVRSALKVGSDGRVPISAQRLRVECPPGSRVVLCVPPSGHRSVLAAPLDEKAKPVLLSPNRQK